ncbi:protein of unknown function (plasmid) [Aminobacter niigataensis]|nr:protein of unknown function [Aminobacter niigataensis]
MARWRTGPCRGPRAARCAYGPARPDARTDKAYEILRLRLQILGNRPDWALGREGGLQYQSPRTANPPVHSKSKPH